MFRYLAKEPKKRRSIGLDSCAGRNRVRSAPLGTKYTECGSSVYVWRSLSISVEVTVHTLSADWAQSFSSHFFTTFRSNP